MDSEYRNTILETVSYLIAVRRDYFSKIINIEMNGDLKEVNEMFELGETYDFNLAHLETSTDSNVHRLTELLKHLDYVIESTINLNNITEEELPEIDE